MFHILAGDFSLRRGECRLQPPHPKFSRESSDTLKGQDGPHSPQGRGEFVGLVNYETGLFEAPGFEHWGLRVF